MLTVAAQFVNILIFELSTSHIRAHSSPLQGQTKVTITQEKQQALLQVGIIHLLDELSSYVNYIFVCG